MDATHYDKIADKLIQFNSKLPETINLEDPSSILMVKCMKVAIYQMLKDIDSMAQQDEKGFLR